MAESIVKKYYDGLLDNKLIGCKCRKCHKYSFPPTLLCSECGSDAIEFVNMSGKGKMLYVSHGMCPPPNPRFANVAPYAYGHVKLDEGCYLHTIISNLPVDNEILYEYFKKCPVDVEADICRLEGDDLPYLAFKVVE